MATSGRGAFTGATTGARLGSAGGPWGALIGGVAGGLGGLFGGSRWLGRNEPDPITENLASFSRAQFEEASRLQYPLQQQLISFAEDPTYSGRQADKAATDVTQQFDVLNQNRQQQEAYQGLALTPEQLAAQKKSEALDRAASVAGARNLASQSAYQNQQAVLRG